MKKNFFRSVAFSAMLLFSVGAANAQKSYEVPPMNPEYQTLADEVNNLNMEDPDKANKVFMKLIKKIAKSKEDLVSVGSYFLDHNNFPAAKQCADKVYDLAADYVPGLMFSGEVYMVSRNYGAAGQKFDEVLLIDSTNVNALKRNAFVYKNVNPFVAREMLARIKRLEPQYYQADKDLGDIQYKADEYKEAVKSYESYYKLVPKDTANLDIRSCENFLMSLYATANFNRILELLPELQPLAPEDMVFKRMEFFANVNKIAESLDYDGAIAKAEKSMAYLTGKEYADSAYTYLDYEYAASLMKEKGDLPAAINYYQQALTCDGTKAVGHKEVATLYRRNKQYDQAISAYKKYMELRGEKLELTDHFGLGQHYLAAMQQDSLDEAKRNEYMTAGDAAFLKVLEEMPTYYKAVLMRAAIHITDGNKPEEEPRKLYEEALKMMESEGEDANPSRFTCHRYLSFYAIQKDDYAMARTHVDAMLKIEPANEMALKMDGYLKSMNK